MLRADLQQYYGICLDDAFTGRYSVAHIVALVQHMPQSARIASAYNDDAKWGMTETLLAVLINRFNMFVWGMSDRKKRGQKPPMIGPRAITDGGKHSLPARALPIEALMHELSKPRRKTRG